MWLTMVPEKTQYTCARVGYTFYSERQQDNK